MRAHFLKGLTLVELIISISLAGIIAIPVGILVSEHLNAAIRARDATIAMNLARYELERLDSLNDVCHVDLTTPSTTTIISYQSLSYTLTRTVSCQVTPIVGNCASNCTSPNPPPSGNNGIKRIAITVTRNSSAEVLASVITYRTKFVRFGP